MGPTLLTWAPCVGKEAVYDGIGIVIAGFKLNAEGCPKADWVNGCDGLKAGACTLVPNVAGAVTPEITGIAKPPTVVVEPGEGGG